MDKNSRGQYKRKEKPMTIAEGAGRARALIGRTFKIDARNKGSVGQDVERAVGLALSSRTLDFADGEMKAFRVNKRGRLSGTIALSQIGSSQIDTLLKKPALWNTRFGKKALKILLVLYKKIKEDEVEICDVILFDANDPLFAAMRDGMEQDFFDIVDMVKNDITVSQNGKMHTASGKYMQIRTKDTRDKKTGNYHPIYSNQLGRYVSDKNFAFYIRRSFLDDIMDAIAGRSIQASCA